MPDDLSAGGGLLIKIAGAVILLGFVAAFWQRLFPKDKTVENKVEKNAADISRIGGSLDAMLAAHAEERRALKDINAALQANLEVTRTEAQKREIELVRQVAEAQALNRKLSEDFARLQDAYDASRIEIHGLRGELQQYKSQAELAALLKPENDRLTKENAVLRQQVDELTKKLPDCKDRT